MRPTVSVLFSLRGVFGASLGVEGSIAGVIDEAREVGLRRKIYNQHTVSSISLLNLTKTAFTKNNISARKAGTV
jgi:hypothetical protein